MTGACRSCGVAFERQPTGIGRPRTRCGECCPRSRSQPSRPRADKPPRRPRRRKGIPDGCPLTRAQYRAICALAQGKSYKQIASETGRSASTIRTTLHNADQTLGVAGAAQAVIHCWRHGWLLPDGTPVHVADRDEDPNLSPAVRFYSLAFDMHLKARTDDERAATRAIMDRALDPMCREQGINPTGRPKRDLVELLVRRIQQQRLTVSETL